MTKKLEHRPSRKWGQNFLTDANVARKIAAAVQTPPPRLLIEIGPGKGMLTRYLLEYQEPYVGIEIDPQLAAYLKETYGNLSHFHLLEGDFLEMDLQALVANYPEHHPVVLGNIPYNITSPILFKLLDHATRLREAILMVQKEVALRLVADPGTKDYGILRILTAVWADVTYLFTVPAARFYPRPKVDSAVVRLQFSSRYAEKIADYNLFRTIVRHSFQQRRKMLKNSLIPLLPEGIMDKLKDVWRKRPEQLSIDEWIALSNQIAQIQRGVANGE